jgi:hypothetical protein
MKDDGRGFIFGAELLHNFQSLLHGGASFERAKFQRQAG